MEEAMASRNERLTIWYEEVNSNDYTLVGKETADQGEMIKAGAPASPGFAVTVHAMDTFATGTGIQDQLSRLVTGIGEASYEAVKPVSDAAMRLIETTELPHDLEDAIVSDYRKLCFESEVPNCPVAVQTSSPASMAGEVASYLNVRGGRGIIDCVRRCWSSVYGIKAIIYRMNAGAPLLLNIGVGISKMVNPRVSGIIFTINPVNGDPSKITIDASYGLRDALASGLITPDTYVIDKVVMEPVKTVIGTKEIQYLHSNRGSDVIQVAVPEESRHAACLTHQETLELARIGKLIENHYGNPCNIEFGIDTDSPFPRNIMILRVRQESVWSKKQTVPRTEKRKDAMDRMVGQLIAGVKLEKERLEHIHRPSLAGHVGCCPLCTLRSLAR
jgi:pyruvate,water dikinase